MSNKLWYSLRIQLGINELLLEGPLSEPIQARPFKHLLDIVEHRPGLEPIVLKHKLLQHFLRNNVRVFNALHRS